MRTNEPPHILCLCALKQKFQALHRLPGRQKNDVLPYEIRPFRGGKWAARATIKSSDLSEAHCEFLKFSYTNRGLFDSEAGLIKIHFVISRVPHTLNLIHIKLLSKAHF